MAYYGQKVQLPPCRVEGTRLALHSAVLPLVEYYKKPPSWVYSLDTWDVITSLDIIYSKIVNEQHYQEYLNKKIKNARRR